MKLVLSNRGLILLLLLALVFASACTKVKRTNEVAFDDWLIDKANLSKLKTLVGSGDCGAIEDLYNKLKFKEHRNTAVLIMAKCYKVSPNLAKKYFLKAFDEGYHIDRLNKSDHPSIWEDLEREFKKRNHVFWTKQDTTHFPKLQELVNEDQLVRLLIKHGVKTFEEECLTDSISTAFLLDYAGKGRYLEPYSPGFFSDLRSWADPSTLAIHANFEAREKIFNCMVENSKKGNISWLHTIAIAGSFYVVRSRIGAVNPLRFLAYKNSRIDYKESLLGLYSLNKVTSIDKSLKITIRPSFLNPFAEKEIEKQLVGLQEFLVHKLGRDPSTVRVENVKLMRDPAIVTNSPCYYTVQLTY